MGTNAFLIFALLAITSWAMPVETLWWRRLRSSYDWLMLPSGLWQRWDMFSPDPMKINAWLDAEFVYADGSVGHFEFPRMERMGMFARFMQERFRKWGPERIRLDENSMLWPDTARYMARIHWNEGPSPPVELRLVRHFSMVPQVEQQFIPFGEEEKVPEKTYMFFHYKVKPSDAPEGGRAMQPVVTQTQLQVVPPNADHSTPASQP